MSLEAPTKLSGSLDDYPSVQKEKLENWGIRPDDLLAILVFVIITMVAAVYIQSMIMSCLEEAGRVSAGLIP